MDFGQENFSSNSVRGETGQARGERFMDHSFKKKGSGCEHSKRQQSFIY
jgi:hypothetical protein